MSKKDNQKPSIKKDTTTDFFLNFIKISHLNLYIKQ